MDSTQYGVAHSDELWQLWNIYFGVYYVNDRSPEIKYVSESMIDMWANFARGGDPTPPDSNLDISWDPVTSEDHRYLVIGRNAVSKHKYFSTKPQGFEVAKKIR